MSDTPDDLKRLKDIATNPGPHSAKLAADVKRFINQRDDILTKELLIGGLSLLITEAVAQYPVNVRRDVVAAMSLIIMLNSTKSGELN